MSRRYRNTMEAPWPTMTMIQSALIRWVDLWSMGCEVFFSRCRAFQINWGGKVPQELYTVREDKETMSTDDFIDTIIKKGSKLKVQFAVDDPGCVLKWVLQPIFTHPTSLTRLSFAGGNSERSSTTFVSESSVFTTKPASRASKLIFDVLHRINWTRRDSSLAKRATLVSFKISWSLSGRFQLVFFRNRSRRFRQFVQLL